MDELGFPARPPRRGDRKPLNEIWPNWRLLALPDQRATSRTSWTSSSGTGLRWNSRTAEAAQKIGQRLRRSIDGHQFQANQSFRSERPSFVTVSKGSRLHAGSIATQKEVKEMNPTRRILVGAAVAGSLLTGGVIGAAIAGPLGASAATTTNVAATAATPSVGSGTFVPNENATHEAGESAAREAQENAGQVPTVP